MHNRLQDKFGPGLMFAASAVGVSHLVQSTRGGAEFGPSILPVIILICLLKYPLFRFGAWYTAATGNTIIEGYRQLGRWILFVILAVYLFELPFAIAGISVVTASVVKSSFGLGSSDEIGALLLVLGCLVLSGWGRYRYLENLSQFFVAVFLVCIVAGAVFAMQGNVNDYELAFEPIPANARSLMFMVALAGWMPVGVGGAIGISLWVHAKNRRIGRRLEPREVCLDFNLGYVIVIFTACCFALLGTYTLPASQDPMSGDSVSFTASLFAILTSSFPQWVHHIVIVGANVVLLSSLLIVVDLLPRLATTLVLTLFPEAATERRQRQLHVGFILYELLCVALVLFLLLRSFTGFIDMVTSLGFLATPIIAWINHKVVFAGDLGGVPRPSWLLRYWNLLALWLTSLVSLGYVGMKLLE
jgi:Mn2+/Fe2+ NRAMP family transporter